MRFLSSLGLVGSPRCVGGLWLLLLCATGCPPAAVQVRPYAAPTVEELSAQLGPERAALRTLRARAKADYMDRGQRIKIDLALLVERPERLRIAGENSLTGPLLTVATDGREFHLLDVRENRFLRGQVNPCNMSRILGLSFHPSQLVEVLMGGTPLLPLPTSREVSWDPRGGGRDVLTLRDDRGVSETIYFQLVPSPAAGPVAAVSRAWDVVEAEGRDPRGNVVWRLRHEGYEVQALGGEESTPATAAASPARPASLRMPSVTYLEDPPRKSDVRLRWREREWNPSIEPGLFRLDAPAGVPVEPDTCSLGPGAAAAMEGSTP